MDKVEVSQPEASLHNVMAPSLILLWMMTRRPFQHGGRADASEAMIWSSLFNKSQTFVKISDSCFLHVDFFSMLVFIITIVWFWHYRPVLYCTH